MKKSMSMQELRELQGREAPPATETSEPIERPLLESEKDQAPADEKDKPADKTAKKPRGTKDDEW